VIYQLLPRLFGNLETRRKPGGTLAENGCGRFADLDERALTALREFGATHLWLTGVLEHASGTDYPRRPADPAALLKGVAGSPYAVRDYFDVCPDFAEDPDERLEEFAELLGRCRALGLRVVIDFVPNHVARSYGSDVRRDLSFGRDDDPSRFFAWDNNFFYVQPGMAEGGPPLRLPGGSFDGERGFVRVTGNNAISFAPSVHDWYETVKLNYGHDFTRGRDTSHLPAPDAPIDCVPDTWRKLDEIFAHWQGLGVGGFRVDMAHLVPLEFWRWLLRRARQRDGELFVFGEAYDSDPAKLCEGNVLDELLWSGFDAVYDDPAYDLCLGLYDDWQGGFKWANDLDELQFSGECFQRSVRYAENHDEVRLASPKEWGGHGMAVGRPVSAVLFALGRGAVMVYHGQEVGEPAIGEAGFSGDDGRTTIFDYWSMPEFQKWVNGGRYDGGGLSAEQRELRDWYARLLGLCQEPALAWGEFFGLNWANRENPDFGRVGAEVASGHWLYAFMRRHAESGQAFLVVANFHPRETLEGVRVRIPVEALEWLGGLGWMARFRERLADDWSVETESACLAGEGVALPAMGPLSARVIEVGRGG